MANNTTNKFSTGIDGLDSLLYGGIHLEGINGEGNSTPVNNDGGLLVLNRGKHGVNKVHLAMQMCEGLHLAMGGSIFQKLPESEKHQKDILFVSLNKNTERLRDTYIGFHLQRLIDQFQVEKLEKEVFQKIINCLVIRDENVFNIKKINPQKVDDKIIDEITIDCLRKGIVFYDERTHSLHLKSGSGVPLQLYELDMEKTADKMRIVFIGRKAPELYSDSIKDRALDSYKKMIESLHDLFLRKCVENEEEIKNELKPNGCDSDKIKSKLYEEKRKKLEHYREEEPAKEIKNKSRFNCVMIDGFSRLTEKEIADCEFHKLTDTLREICKVGVITADEKLPPSAITVDIVIDMEIHEEEDPHCLQNRLRFSKCLYQKNVYGWHNYKMRRTGIEVIPSIHFQMNSRHHMDDAVQNALLEMDEIPYQYWINEGGQEDSKEHKWGDNITASEQGVIAGYECLNTGYLYALSVDKMDDGRYLMNKIDGLLDVADRKKQVFLFIDLSRTRKEFCDNYHYPKRISEKLDCEEGNLHLFNFRPGHIHDDDFLYTIEKQVRAIARKAYPKGDEEQSDYENRLWRKFKNIHLVIGDINYINFAYPCLNRDNLLLPAISNFTKKYHMTNFIYSTASWEISILEKEKELYQQMKVVSTMLF